MTDNSELQRLTRLRRLARQIAASLREELDLDDDEQEYEAAEAPPPAR